MLSITFFSFKDPVEATRIGENATVNEGGSITLACPVVGNPEPNIKWFKGSEASGTPMSSKQDLTVRDVRESVCYRCIASNSIGTQVSIAQCLIVGKSNLQYSFVVHNNSNNHHHHNVVSWVTSPYHILLHHW